MVFCCVIFNHFLNILKLFHVLPNFALTTNETMRDYYLKGWYIRVVSHIAKQLKTSKRVSKFHKVIPY